MIKRLIGIAVFSAAISQNICAQDADTELKRISDEMTAAMTDTAMAQPKGNVFTRLLDYFNNANKEKELKKFDISFIGGPHYSNDVGFGVGLLGAGVYSMKGCAPDLHRSSVSLFGDVTTKLNFTVGVEGYNIFPEDKYRLRYDIKLRQINFDHYGIGYDMCSVDDNLIKMKSTEVLLNTSFLMRLCRNLYFGPQVNAQYSYMRPRHLDAMPELYGRHNEKQRNIAVGANLELDTRDNIQNPYHGIFFNTIYQVAPRWIGNRALTHNLEANLRGYVQTWEGCVLAGELYSRFAFGDVEYIHLSQMAKSGHMRGYDQWQYIDRHTASAQVELRQHIWKRSGAVLWGGVGSSFHDKESIHLLPTYGLGYRWEFKKRINVRLDYGFGKNCSTFIFAINEAF